MKWLITIQESADINRVMEAIRSYGGEPDQDNPPIPLGDTELIVQAGGPSELGNLLKSVSDIIDVYPDSEVQLYLDSPKT